MALNKGELARDAGALVGVGITLAGLWSIYRPLLLVCGGLALVVTMILWSWKVSNARPPHAPRVDRKS